MTSRINIDSLGSGYGKNHVLHDVAFTADNEITAIVGSNGSGKSTLLKSIFGLCDIYAGKIIFDEHDITRTPTHKITDLGISYMAQRENVFGELNIYENLVISSLPAKPDLDATFDFFPILEQFRNKKAKDLSGGQRQMLAMAMILTKNPRVILFDEPTANLSPKNADLVLDKIQEIQKKLHNCIILVEQNVKNTLGICDKCYLFSSGKVVYHGNPQQLLNDSHLVGKYLGLT